MARPDQSSSLCCLLTHCLASHPLLHIVTPQCTHDLPFNPEGCRPLLAHSPLLHHSVQGLCALQSLKRPISISSFPLPPWKPLLQSTYLFSTPKTFHDDLFPACDSQEDTTWGSTQKHSVVTPLMPDCLHLQRTTEH